MAPPRSRWNRARPDLEVIEGGVTYGVLSMEGYVFGELPATGVA